MDGRAVSSPPPPRFRYRSAGILPFTKSLIADCSVRSCSDSRGAPRAARRRVPRRRSVRRCPPSSPSSRREARGRSTVGATSGMGTVIERRPHRQVMATRGGDATVATVRPLAGAAASRVLAVRRGLCCAQGLAQRKARRVSAPSARRVRPRAPWHVSPAHAHGHAHRAVLLPDGPRNLQSAARLSRQSRSRAISDALEHVVAHRRGGAQRRSGRRRPAAGHHAALGGAVGAAAADARSVAPC